MAESVSAWEPGVDLPWWENVLVAIRFRPVDRDQEFLLPPNMTDWVGPDHVVWFLIEVVEQLDLTPFYARAARRRDGQPSRSAAGRAAFDPRMLLTLLLYGYACGERSSREIERLCHTDLAFRLICADDIPDHSVIARFRQHHEDAFAGLFTQVLLLCREAGLVKLCTVAIDGTKIAANASPLANRGEAWLRAEAAKPPPGADGDDTTGDGSGGDGSGGDGSGGDEFAGVVGQILAEAEQTDTAQDALFGDTRGDQLPPGWDRHGAERQARIAAGLARIEQAKQDKEAERAAKAAEQARRDAADLAAAEQALATELATRLAAQHAWEQRWASALDHPGTPLPRGRAPKPAEESAVVKRARARVDTARERVDHPDTAPRRGGRTPNPDTPNPDRRGRRDRDRAPRANLTDPDSSIMPTIRGWLQAYNTQFAHSADQMIVATMVATNPADILCFTPMIDATQQAAALLEATNELGTVLLDTGYASDATLSAPGPDRLIALGKSHSVQTRARQHPTCGPPPPELTARQQMDHRLRTPEGAKLYKRRGATVEPGIGNFKKLLDRYSRRGLNAVISETHLAAAVFNLLKLHRAAPT